MTAATDYVTQKDVNSGRVGSSATTLNFTQTLGNPIPSDAEFIFAVTTKDKNGRGVNRQSQDSFDSEGNGEESDPAPLWGCKEVIRSKSNDFRLEKMQPSRQERPGRIRSSHGRIYGIIAARGERRGRVLDRESVVCRSGLSTEKERLQAMQQCVNHAITPVVNSAKNLRNLIS